MAGFVARKFLYISVSSMRNFLNFHKKAILFLDESFCTIFARSLKNKFFRVILQRIPLNNFSQIFSFSVMKFFRIILFYKTSSGLFSRQILSRRTSTQSVERKLWREINENIVFVRFILIQPTWMARPILKITDTCLWNFYKYQFNRHNNK